MKKRLSKLAVLSLVASTIVCGINPQPAMAASAKDKAISAYNKYMSQKTIKWGDKKAKTYQCQYYFVNVDNNDVPEMIVLNPNGSHTDGNACLYTYSGGDVKYVDISCDGMEYYKKTGIYTVEYDSMGYFNTTYMKLSGGQKSVVASQTYNVDNGSYTYYNASNSTISKTDFDSICNQYGITSTSSALDISETANIKSFLENNGIDKEIEYRTIIDQKSPNWTALKTDLAIKACGNSLKSEDLYNVYHDYTICYSGWGTKNSSANISKINTAGKKLFGSKFKANFSKSKRSNAFNFLSSDKAYILDNRPDTGDYSAEGNYSAIYKSGSTYVVKYSCRNSLFCDGKDKALYDSVATIKLKKTKSGSFYITQITWKSHKA